MRYFIPTNPESGTVFFYGGKKCSPKMPASATGYRAEKAANNPDFTEVEKPRRKKKAK